MTDLTSEGMIELNSIDIMQKRRWFPVPVPAGWAAAELLDGMDDEEEAFRIQSWTWAGLSAAKGSYGGPFISADPLSCLEQAEAWVREQGL